MQSIDFLKRTVDQKPKIWLQNQTDIFWYWLDKVPIEFKQGKINRCHKHFKDTFILFFLTINISKPDRDNVATNIIIIIIINTNRQQAAINNNSTFGKQYICDKSYLSTITY